MLHILTVIGARPQVIKAAALSRAIRTKFSVHIRETIVHTGQHYDDNMSRVFFEELDIPAPDYNLGVGSGTHGKQTAAMIAGIEEILLKENPAALVVYGDTNSTLAGAIAANKLHVPVVHIEAGLRSHNKRMPEEVNRILCDHVSSLLFSPTQEGIDNLQREGLVATSQNSPNAPAIYHCGDVMYDNSVFFAEKAEAKAGILKKEKLAPGNYFLATVHRDFNTDVPGRLSTIFDAFFRIAAEHKMPVVIPLHPRTRAKIGEMPELEKKIKDSDLVRLLPPASFLEMIVLEKNAKLVLTDSGGVQKEAFFFQKPCVILRAETEWVELVHCGAAITADADTDKIEKAVRTLLQGPLNFPPVFGDGHAAEFICTEMLRLLAR